MTGWWKTLIGGLAVWVATLGVLVVTSLLEEDLSVAGWVYPLVRSIEELVKGVLIVTIGWRVVPKVYDVALVVVAALGIGALLVIAGLTRRHHRRVRVSPAAEQGAPAR